MAAEHEICLELVRTRGTCFLTDAASVGAVVKADHCDVPGMPTFRFDRAG